MCGHLTFLIGLSIAACGGSADDGAGGAGGAGGNNGGDTVTLVVDSSQDLFNSALEDALHRMGQVLTRHKEKLVGRNRRGGRIGH